MFTSVIGALTSALPKYFIWGAYVPVLIFSFLNLGLTYLLSAPARLWLGKAYGTNSTLAVVIAFTFTVVVAYVVSAASDFMRLVLEGDFLENWLFQRLGAFLSGRQQTIHRRMQDEYLSALERRYQVEELHGRWVAVLQRGAEEGVKANFDERRRSINEEQNIPALAHPSRRTAPEYDAASLGAQRIEALRDETGDPGMIATAQITDAVNALADELRAQNKLENARLSRDHKELLLIIDTVLNTALTREYEAALKLNVTFSGDTPAPTRMGNVADAIQAYGMQRYAIDLTVLWSRLQATLVKGDAKDLSSVLDAKTQLDFLVACCCFTALTAAAWALVLLTFGGALGLVLIFAGIGPLAVWCFSWLATESYIAYSITLRACVDVNRFALLRALELPLPSTLHAELRLWHALSAAAVSGNTAELSYEHPTK